MSSLFREKSRGGRRQTPLRGGTYLYGIILAVVTFTVYSPALRYGFVSLDDYLYVVDNEHIRSLNMPFLKWSFTNFTGGNWHPLTWLSLGLDHALWGLNPMGFHLHNILIHCLNAFLVLILFERILAIYRKNHSSADEKEEGERNFATAMAAAAIFSLHPLRVESVVWITERKDVLCAFFSLVSMLLYLSYATRRPSDRAGAYYLASLAAFALALLSKSMAVTLPAAFLVFDSFCLERLDIRKASSWLTMIREKLPFFLLSAVTSAVAVAGQTKGGGIRTLAAQPVADRVVNAVHAFSFYVFKTVLPTGLSPYYPVQRASDLLRPDIVFSVAFFVLIVFSCVLSVRKRIDAWTGVWTFYAVTLLPVSGLVQVGAVGAADRFTYLPTLGLALLVSSGLLRVVGRISPSRLVSMPVLGPAAAAVLAAALVPFTLAQIRIWSSSLSLADKAVAENRGEATIPYTDRGFALIDRGDYRNAVADCTRALALSPTSPDALMCRAEAREEMGDLARAISDYNSFLRLYPVHSVALNRRGIAYLKAGDSRRAQADFDLSDLIGAEMARIGKAPADASGDAVRTHTERGIAWLNAGEAERAIEECGRALSLREDCMPCLMCRADALSRKGDHRGAIADYTALLGLNPVDGEALTKRGNEFLKTGERLKARADFDLSATIMNR